MKQVVVPDRDVEQTTRRNSLWVVVVVLLIRRGHLQVFGNQTDPRGMT
jgi:hypothetical protein